MRHCTCNWTTWKCFVAAVATALLPAGTRFSVEVARADEPEAPQSAAADPAEPLLAAVKGQSAASGTDRRDKPSEAEYIARLQRAIETDRNQLDELVREQDDPQGEYADAKAEFERLDAERAELRLQIEELKRFGKRREIAELEERIAALESEWKTARERFDLAIKVRKALREKVASIQEKIQKDAQTLQSLTEPPQEELAETAAPTPVGAAKADAPKPAEALAEAPQDSGGPTSSVLEMSPAVPGVDAATTMAGARRQSRTPAASMRRMRWRFRSLATVASRTLRALSGVGMSAHSSRNQGCAMSSAMSRNCG